MRQNAVIFVCAWSTVGCTSFYPPKTPRDVDLGPLLAIELTKDVDQIETLERFLPPNVTHHRENGSETLVFKTPNDRSDNDHVHRVINISRHDSAEGALNDYRSYRRTLEIGSDWKFYEEGGSDANRYFSAYKMPWMNENHGIPMGVIDDPEIVILNQKRNLLLVVSYSSHEDSESYAREINEDISYLSGVLRKWLR